MKLSLIICASTLILISCNQSEKTIVSESTQSIPVENKIEPVKYSKNGQPPLDSFVINETDLNVELLFSFNENFSDSTFNRDSWMMVYKAPKMYLGKYLSLHFNYRTLIFETNGISFCDSCLNISELEPFDFSFFGPKPYIMPNTPEHKTWKKETIIKNTIGEIKVLTKSAFCYDTGNHALTIEENNKTLSLKETNNIILFEADLNEDSINETYVVEYANCAGFMNIYKIENAS